MDNCKWIYRPGTDNSHFAMATCDSSMKYLSKIPNSPPEKGCCDFYNGATCPSCSKPISMDYRMIEKEGESK